MFWSPWNASGCVRCSAQLNPCSAQLKLSPTTYARGTMTTSRYRGRRAATIENADLRVTVLEEGGHIAEIVDKATGVNPLWTPPWPTIEPSHFGLDDMGTYGGGSDARLLAGIMGHNLCLDIFGPPSDEEAIAGLTAHGEGSVVRYELTAVG